MSYALLSVSDKSGITVLARGLIEVGYKIISSGGTYAALQAEGIPATVSYTHLTLPTTPYV